MSNTLRILVWRMIICPLTHRLSHFDGGYIPLQSSGKNNVRSKRAWRGWRFSSDSHEETLSPCIQWTSSVNSVLAFSATYQKPNIKAIDLVNTSLLLSNPVYKAVEPFFQPDWLSIVTVCCPDFTHHWFVALLIATLSHTPLRADRVYESICRNACTQIKAWRRSRQEPTLVSPLIV